MFYLFEVGKSGGALLHLLVVVFFSSSISLYGRFDVCQMQLLKVKKSFPPPLPGVLLRVVLLSHPSLMWCCVLLLGGDAFSFLLLGRAAFLRILRWVAVPSCEWRITQFLLDQGTHHS